MKSHARVVVIGGAVDTAATDDLRARMISLSIWGDRYTSDVIAGRDSIDSLISVNVAVIEGLPPNTARLNP